MEFCSPLQKHNQLYDWPTKEVRPLSLWCKGENQRIALWFGSSGGQKD